MGIYGSKIVLLHMTEAGAPTLLDQVDKVLKDAVISFSNFEDPHVETEFMERTSQAFCDKTFRNFKFKDKWYTIYATAMNSDNYPSLEIQVNARCSPVFNFSPYVDAMKKGYHAFLNFAKENMFLQQNQRLLYVWKPLAWATRLVAKS